MSAIRMGISMECRVTKRAGSGAGSVVEDFFRGEPRSYLGQELDVGRLYSATISLRLHCQRSDRATTENSCVAAED